MTAFSDLPQLIAGRYKPLSEIGRGGMGSVILVEHVNTGDRLALKFLHRSFGENADIVERFKREARAAAKIKSDHVVRITDADVSPELDGLPFMVMEVLNGEDLKKRLAARGQLPREEVVGVLWQVARALDRAHAMGIIHRDLKPENIFLHHNEDGAEIVKVLDFGISKMLGDVDATSTQTGMVLGTPYFMAPEQIKNAPVSAQTDVWAIGMVAYKLLVGVNYWPSASMGELMAMVLATPMDPPTARPRAAPFGPQFDAWFFRSCDRDPSRRWHSVGEQVSALADVFGVQLPQNISGASGPFTGPGHSHVPQQSGPAVASGFASGSFPNASMPSAANAASGHSVAGVTGSTPQTKSGSGTVVAVVAFCALVVVGFGSWHFASQRLRRSAPAASTSAAPQMSSPAQPATAITAAPVFPTASEAPAASAAPMPSATPTAALSVLPVATAPAPMSTHAHAASTSAKKGAADTSKGEDPWAR